LFNRLACRRAYYLGFGTQASIFLSSRPKCSGKSIAEQQTFIERLMKKIVSVAVVALIAIITLTAAVPAEQGQKYEYAIVKWDGPDRLYYNLPGKFELVYLSKTGVQVPKEAQAEEFCLSVAANIMAKEGWEPMDLDSRRLLFRRPVK
jgi:hypothetical protein